MKKFDEKLVNVCLTLPVRQNDFLKSIKTYLHIYSSEFIRNLLDDFLAEPNNPLLISLEAKRKQALTQSFTKPDSDTDK